MIIETDVEGIRNPPDLGAQRLIVGGRVVFASDHQEPSSGLTAVIASTASGSSTTWVRLHTTGGLKELDDDAYIVMASICW